MLDENAIKCIHFVKSFVDKYLERNIDNIKHFSFLNLNTDIKYHQPNIKIEQTDIKIYGDFLKVIYATRDCKYWNHNYDKQNNSYIDYDTMNLARAINYLLYYGKLPNLSWEDLTWEVQHGEVNTLTNVYRGETINSFNTLIKENSYKEYFANNTKLIEQITDFMYKAFSIGNFMLLPNMNYGGKTLNTYKGLCLGDYSDRFFDSIKNKNTDEYIDKLIEANSFYFSKIDSFEKFIEVNYLQDYVDSNGDLNYSFNPYYKYWNFDKSNNLDEKEIYAHFIEKYIRIVTDKINKRAERICNQLKLIFSEYELLNPTLNNGYINIEEADIIEAFKSSKVCNIETRTFKSDEIKDYISNGILSTEDITTVKHLAVAINHNKDFSLYDMSEVMKLIEKKYSYCDMNFLFVDYIDNNLDNNISITTYTLK